MTDTQDRRWETLKDILRSDLEHWNMSLNDVEGRRTLSVDLKERAELEGAVGMFHVYIEILTHYLSIMEVAEKFTDGGTETADT